MKIVIGLLFATLALSGVFAMPAGDPSDDAEVITVPRRPLFTASDDDDSSSDDKDFRSFKGVIDTGAGYPFLQPHPHPFSLNLGFFDSFEDIFRRLRQRMWPSELAGDASDETAPDGGLFGVKFSPKDGNTTSTVKVVDGHKIEVNETVYGDQNNVFKVRVVNIRPVESDEEVQETVPSSDPIKPVTSGPNTKTPESNESDERREPIEKQPAENEVRGNIDEPEHPAPAQYHEEEKEAEVTTPVAPDEDNTASLNGTFVADNSPATTTRTELESEVEHTDANAATDKDGEVFKVEVEIEEAARDDPNGSGNSEAETNKPDSLDMTEENYDATTAIAAREEQLEALDSHVGDDEQFTIETNEEKEAVDNLNESPSAEEAAAVESLDVGDGGDADNGEGEGNSDSDTLEKRLSALELVAGPDPVAAAVEWQQTDKKTRENFYSSDDDSDAEGVELPDGFREEWGDNELSNDIDDYEGVPIDLSNDIAVNDWAAQQSNFPSNPDAETFEVVTMMK